MWWMIHFILRVTQLPYYDDHTLTHLIANTMFTLYTDNCLYYILRFRNDAEREISLWKPNNASKDNVFDRKSKIISFAHKCLLIQSVNNGKRNTYIQMQLRRHVYQENVCWEEVDMAVWWPSAQTPASGCSNDVPTHHNRVRVLLASRQIGVQFCRGVENGGTRALSQMSLRSAVRRTS